MQIFQKGKFHGLSKTQVPIWMEYFLYLVQNCLGFHPNYYLHSFLYTKCFHPKEVAIKLEYIDEWMEKGFFSLKPVFCLQTKELNANCCPKTKQIHVWEKVN